METFSISNNYGVTIFKVDFPVTKTEEKTEKLILTIPYNSNSLVNKNEKEN